MPPTTRRMPYARTWAASERRPVVDRVGSPPPRSTSVPVNVVPSCSPWPRTSVSIRYDAPSVANAAYVNGNFSFDAGASGSAGFWA